jgi:hypothetical protein
MTEKVNAAVEQIRRAYWILLDRAPNEYEMSHFLQQILLRGVTATDVLEAIRAQRSSTPTSLPEAIRPDVLDYDVEALVFFPDADFVLNSWRCVLKRDPSSEEFSQALALIGQSYVGRIHVLQELVRSPEAKASVRGLDRWDVLSQTAAPTDSRTRPALDFARHLWKSAQKLPELEERVRILEDLCARQSQELALLHAQAEAFGRRELRTESVVKKLERQWTQFVLGNAPPDDLD